MDISTTQWSKSSYSGSEINCVEVARITGQVALRDSKRPQAGHLTFSVPEWAAFLAAAKDREL